MKILKSSTILFVFVLIGCLMSANFVFASNTDGIIDGTYKYAWGENIGWINFGTANGNVHVTDSVLSGYALSETIGWIYLGDITNDNEGNLSGYAWSENAGWINFNPDNGGVVINSSGEFTGSALGENVGWIIFDGDYVVKTDWRLRSARPQCNNSIDDDSDGETDYPNDPDCDSSTDDNETRQGGGGGLPAGAFSAPVAPKSGFRVLINNDAAETDSRKVVLTLKGESSAKTVWISENSQFPEDFQTPYDSSLSQISVSFTLSKGEGSKTIYAKFCTQYGHCSEVVFDGIILIKAPTIVEKIKEAPERIVEEIKKVPEILKQLTPEFLKPEKEDEEEIEEIIILEEAPLSMRGQWKLLSQESIQAFVLAPLPKEIIKLAEKFPELGETLKKVGITKITDIEKLKTVKLTLPGLTERMGLLAANVEPGKFTLPVGVPVAELSSQIKKQIPSEIVFAKTGGELIDFNIALSVTEQGEPKQKISTISGKSLQLVVKPDKPVKSVKGYVVFKSKNPSPTSLELPSNSLLASLIFANPVFAKIQEQPVRVEEKLVLLEFEYTDPDGDGIYTAEIQAPIVDGEYEIITVMEFEDPELGKKEIRLITVVDPEGYIYEKNKDKETRIPGAIVFIYWLNPETKQYEIWPAEEYQQDNPQITNATGKYSFLVPEGSYYLSVESPGYLSYDGKPFQVKEGSGVHTNIELKTKYWWLKIVDWKTILLTIVIILLLYNFYRDKIREKLLKRQLK